MESIQTNTFGDFSAYYMISLKLNIYKYLMLLLFPFRRECGDLQCTNFLNVQKFEEMTEGYFCEQYKQTTVLPT